MLVSKTGKSQIRNSETGNPDNHRERNIHAKEADSSNLIGKRREVAEEVRGAFVASRV